MISPKLIIKTLLNFWKKPSPIERKIEYKFRSKSLLFTALTHKSVKPSPKENYERLEFLGDAVIDHVVSEWLFDKYPHADEGELTLKRAAFVKKAFLARMGKNLNLLKYSIVSTSLDTRNKKVARNLLGNIYESLVGAIFLDGGMDPAEKFLHKFLLKYEDQAVINDNFKGRLIEFCQERGDKPPRFKVKKVTGPDHNKTFSIEVNMNGNLTFEGKGKSKKEGEQNASKMALKILN